MPTCPRTLSISFCESYPTPFFKYRLDIFNVLDLFRRIAFDQHQVGLLTRGDRTDVLPLPEVGRTIQALRSWIASTGVNPASTSNSTSR